MLRAATSAGVGDCELVSGDCAEPARRWIQKSERLVATTARAQPVKARQKTARATSASCCGRCCRLLLIIISARSEMLVNAVERSNR